MNTDPVPLPPLRARLNLNPAEWGVQAYAELGVAVALAAVLGQVRLFVMPQGGSVSLELLPIVFIAVRRGVVPGLAAGVTELPALPPAGGVDVLAAAAGQVFVAAASASPAGLAGGAAPVPDGSAEDALQVPPRRAVPGADGAAVMRL